MIFEVRKNTNDEKYLAPLAGQVPGQGVPLGTILAYYGTTAPSSNWLICDGSTFDQDQYPALALFLGSNKLPDLRGKTTFGADTENIGDTTDGALPNIYGKVGVMLTRGYSGEPASGAFSQVGSLGLANGAEGAGSANKGVMDLNASRSSSIYTDGQETVVPSSVYVNYIIKATSVASDTDKQGLYTEIQSYIKPAIYTGTISDPDIVVPSISTYSTFVCGGRRSTMGTTRAAFETVEVPVEFLKSWTNLGVHTKLNNDQSASFICFVRHIAYDEANDTLTFGFSGSSEETGTTVYYDNLYAMVKR